MTNKKNNTGSSYVPLPFHSSQIVNMQNNDDECCFLWSVISHLHPAPHHKKRLRNYNEAEYINEFSLSDGLNEFSSDYNKLIKFHNENKHLIEANAYFVYISTGNCRSVFMKL